MDAPPPPPHVETTQLPAAEVGAANAEQAELCKKASHFDWEYMSAMVLADAGTVVLDSQVFQSSGQTAVRLVGPGLVGLAWGWSIGGAYLTLPQCSPDFVNTRPPEGEVRSEIPLAIGFSVLAGAMAPVIVGVETGEGPTTLLWSPAERVMRLVIASATGVVGSVMPYVLPPSNWRAMKKLERLKVAADNRGGMVSYGVVF